MTFKHTQGACMCINSFCKERNSLQAKQNKLSHCHQHQPQVLVTHGLQHVVVSQLVSTHRITFLRHVFVRFSRGGCTQCRIRYFGPVRAVDINMSSRLLLVLRSLTEYVDVPAGCATAHIAARQVTTVGAAWDQKEHSKLCHAVSPAWSSLLA